MKVARRHLLNIAPLAAAYSSNMCDLVKWSMSTLSIHSLMFEENM